MVTDPKQQCVLEAMKHSINQSADSLMTGAWGFFKILCSKSLFHSCVKDKRQRGVEHEDGSFQSDSSLSKIIFNVDLKKQKMKSLETKGHTFNKKKKRFNGSLKCNILSSFLNPSSLQYFDFVFLPTPPSLSHPYAHTCTRCHMPPLPYVRVHQVSQTSTGFLTHRSVPLHPSRSLPPSENSGLY